MFNKPHTKETKRKISKSLKNHPIYKSRRRSQNISNALIQRYQIEGKPGSVKGKHWKLSKKAREKARQRSLGKRNNMYGRTGDKAPSWKGGVSREPYSFDFNGELKELVRKRDNYTCQICRKKWRKNTIAFDVHHIDYDKKNNDPKNLITLCSKCHGKTNHNRKRWQKLTWF